jgi:hypothetical protein
MAYGNNEGAFIIANYLIINHLLVFCFLNIQLLPDFFTLILLIRVFKYTIDIAM